MKLLVSAVLLILSVMSAMSDKARFDNYRVYTIAVENETQLKVLKEIAETSDSYSFWEEPSHVGADVELIVPPHQFAHFSEIVEKFNMKTTLMNNNLQETIDKQRAPKQGKAADMEWTGYQTLETIYDWLDSLEQDYPEFISLETIGFTYENRPLRMVKLSKKAGNRAIFLEANIHAREWISSATATYVLNELLTSNDPEVQDLATNIDWYIIPVLNPDGFVYTHTENRNWRKTRSPTSLVCFGVDPNRNFAHNWLIPDENGDFGASRAPCSDTFAGSHPFSESETAAVENYLAEHYELFDVYLSFHSYGHQILHPWGTSFGDVPNVAQLTAIGEAARDKLALENGINYSVGSTRGILYAASGISVDHAYGKYGIQIAYTYEMRGNGEYGNYGFFLPPEHILPNSVEILESLKALVAQTRVEGFLPITPAN